MEDDDGGDGGGNEGSCRMKMYHEVTVQRQVYSQLRLGRPVSLQDDWRWWW